MAWGFSWCTSAVYKFYLLLTYETVLQAGCSHKGSVLEKLQEAEAHVSNVGSRLTCPEGKWGDTARGSFMHFQSDIQGKTETASPSHPIEEKVKVLLSTAASWKDIDNTVRLLELNRVG